MIKIKYRIPKAIHNKMMDDLQRPHEHAWERIGFLFTKSKLLINNTILITAMDYVPVDDEDYINDEEVGARINATAIRKAMQKSLDIGCGIFHVHLHKQTGKPSMSWTDEDGIPPMVESFANVSKDQCHGLMILSMDALYVEVKVPECQQYLQPDLITIVGYPSKFYFLDKKKTIESEVYDRQSFLGSNSQHLFEKINVGIVGYGGGGSHIGQQLAHLGFVHQTIFDDDIIEDSNLNRLVGAWKEDIKKRLNKIQIAKRTIGNILPGANITGVASRWQLDPEKLQLCDIVVGGVDSYAERQQLEAECRRYLIPYIDIGMDVHKIDKSVSMSGQIILSMPGFSCMTCLGYLTDDKLAKEAAKYGAVGGRPQVVWPNGILASTAVGLVVDLVTGWSGLVDRVVYLAYDGNLGTLTDHIRLKFVNNECLHYGLEDVGAPIFVPL